MITVSEIEQAQRTVTRTVKETPLRPFTCSLKPNQRFWLKCENFQVTGSFKIRGALNRLAHLRPAERERGVVTRSSGNFAQALALASQLHRMRCHVVMPLGSSQKKIELTERYRPLLTLAGSNAAEADDVADHLCKERGYIRVSAYNDRHVITGQGTAGWEIARQHGDVGTVIVPVGGGGLMAGCAIALRALHPKCRLIAVEPSGANDYFLSRRRGTKVRLEQVTTIADGLRTPTVGERTYTILNAMVDEVVHVGDGCGYRPGAKPPN